jgi:hypothetical protein
MSPRGSASGWVYLHATNTKFTLLVHHQWNIELEQFRLPETGGEDGHTLGINHICRFHDLIIGEWNADVPW